MGFFSDSFLFGNIIGLDLILNLLCISHKLTACRFQKGASVHFSFELVAVYKPNADRCGYESLAVVSLQRMLVFMVVFMDLLIPGLLVCVAELTQGLQHKTSMEFQDLFRKASGSFQASTKLLTGKTSTSGNLLEGKQIQVTIV